MVDSFASLSRLREGSTVSLRVAAAGGDGFLVGVCEGELRHVIRVPCTLVEFDEGLTLVRALYRSGFPKELSAAPSARSLSL